MATRPIRISVVADANKAQKELSALGRAMKTTVVAGAAVGAAALVGFAVTSVKSLARIERINTQTAAAIKSTGKAAGVTAGHVEELAGSLEAMTATEAESIQTGANFLLTFTNIRNGVGKSNQIFDRTVRAMTDMSRAMDNTGGVVLDTRTQALQLGKALNDPVKGVTALQRVGVSFTQKQRDQIKTMVESGKTMKAQKLILRELEKEFGGSGAAFAKTTVGQIELAKHELGTLGETIMEGVLPPLARLATQGTAKLKELGKYAPQIQSFAGDVFDLGKTFAEELIPPLKTAGKVVVDTVRFFSDLPGPVKEVGAQAVIAAVVLPRVAGALLLVRNSATAAGASMVTFGQRLAQNRAAMTYATGVYGKTAAALHGFGGAARSIAGVGGVVALTQGMTSTNQTTKALLTTVGGLATGFSVGGPVGAAVGGLAGLMIGLQDGTNRAEVAAVKSITTWQTYASTLDSVTGATSRATKSMVIQELQQNGLLTKARELGISQSTLVNGVLGHAKASGQLSSAIKTEEASIREASKAYMEKYDTSIARNTAEGKAVFDSIQARRANIDAIKAEVGEVAKSTKQKREELLLLQNFPDIVITKIQTPGAVDSRRELANLVATYKLTPKQIRTVIKMNGISTSVKEVRGLAGEIVKSGKVKPSDAWRGQFRSDVDRAKRDANTGLGLLNGTLSRAGDVKPNFTKFNTGLTGGINSAKGTASRGGYQVGANLGDGFSSGVQSRAAILAAVARNAVLGAISVANKAGDIRSPSRKTRYTGEMLGAGLAGGLRASAPRAKTAGQKLMLAVLAGVKSGSSGVSTALDKVTAQIEKSITGKNESARERALLKRYAATFRALRQNGLAQDRVTAKLEKARDKLKELTDQYADYKSAIVDSIRATGDVTQLGRQDDGTVSVTSLLNELKNKVVAAQRFSSLMQQLAKQGLSQTAIQQMLDAGPEAALATAEAIASGGASAITEINALQTELAKTGTQLGGSMADRYYGAGVQAAQGLVKGLEAEAAALDKVATRIATTLVTAVKRALGIRSPSRVFTKIGDNVMKGLQIGIDDTHAKTAGARAAASLQKGFGKPALEAFARTGDGGSDRTITLRLTADQLDRLSRGKQLVADIDYAIDNGVRPTRIGVG